MARLSERNRRVLELVVCAVLVTIIALFALWRMDLLNPAKSYIIRNNDQARTAYVAKNIVEGRGYTTDFLPAYLVDFYDQRGKLHDEHWANGDRFPFAAYAIAALYTVTGTTSPWVGVLLYNLIFFVAFLTLLYRLAWTVWGDRFSAVAVVALALLHPHTYAYLYLKDSDLLLLTTAVMLCLVHYLKAPVLTRWRAVVLGSVLAWLLLMRPNVGAPLILAFIVIALRRAWTSRGNRSLRDVARELAVREGVIALVGAAWCAPFIVLSLREWGSPYFSFASYFQMPLGTRFLMNGDPWWKAAEPGKTVTLSTLLHEAPDQLVAKYTTTWFASARHIVSSFATELVLACGLLATLGAAAATPASAEGADRRTAQSVRVVAAALGLTFLVNVLTLPLYTPQRTELRHYLGFMFPLIWLCAGHALCLVFGFARRAADALRARASALLERVPILRFVLPLAALAWLVVWNFGGRARDANVAFAATTQLFEKRWPLLLIVLIVALTYRSLRRAPVFAAVAVVFVLIMVRGKPDVGFLRGALVFFPADQSVWDTLRERRGTVSSLSLPSEVPWMTGRKNLPTPQWTMMIYSYLYDHKIEIEDIYLESAELMAENVFAHSAPGFEEYVRLQKYRGRLPGYQLVFDKHTTLGYPRFGLWPRPKASSVYRLVDREAVRQLAKSPDRIAIGDVEDIVYAAHGFEGYYTIDDKRVIAATDKTRRHYPKDYQQPWESSGVTFFLDATRTPTSVDLELYATQATTLEFYWNLDLHKYDTGEQRGRHHIGSFEVQKPGWHSVHLDVPPGVARVGLNKLGFRGRSFDAVVLCPPDLAEPMCRATLPDDDDVRNARVERVPAVTEPGFLRVSTFLHTIGFQYQGTAGSEPSPVPGGVAAGAAAQP